MIKMRKLDERQIAEISKLRALGYSQSEIARRLGVTQTAVSHHLKRIRKMVEKYGEDEVFSRIVASLIGYEGALLGYVTSMLVKERGKNE